MTTSFPFGSSTGTANAITGLAADGFTVGNAGEANASGTVYHYASFNNVAASVLAGSYTGNGIDNRNITGVGFQPEYLMIRANDTGTARSGHQRPASLTGTGSQFWAATANSTNAIQALSATGFQVGTDTSVNASGPTYHYMAFKNTGGGCSVGGSDDRQRNIGLLGKPGVAHQQQRRGQRPQGHRQVGQLQHPRGRAVHPADGAERL